MKFNEYVYTRPDFESFKNTFYQALEIFNNAKTADEQIEAMATISQLRLDFSTMENLAYIRHTMNTQDAFYADEIAYFDEMNPLMAELENAFYQALLSATFEADLQKRFGSLLFEKARLKQKTFNKAIIEDMQQENKLTTEYRKLLASAKIEFEGKTRNLSQMAPFAQSKDRDMRKRASQAVSAFFSDNESTLDRIYDDLVKARNTMAKKLGYSSFVQLAYDRLGRLDYTASDVKNYRDQVYEALVPVVKSLVSRKGKRLGIEDMKSYDLSLEFLSGNPTPKGEREWMVKQATEMYEAMSEETKEFIHFMTDKELLDLDAKEGKSGGGYCTYIPNYSSPFIFANFNGTSHDVDVLTHEAGHAFQVYSSRHFEVSEYFWPTYEAAEIHSMSMEFFAWPWIDKFFQEDTDKYKFSHLAGALTFIPYGVAVDEFQHAVYENPELTPEERKLKWRDIEKKYLPYKVYDNDPFMERGGFWFRQSHIFEVPFYYIDYTLAQVCAFQYWAKDQQDHASAWNSYVKLCQMGGSKTFLDLVKSSGLDSPFVSGTIKKYIQPIQAYLDAVDDSKF